MNIEKILENNCLKVYADAVDTQFEDIESTIETLERDIADTKAKIEASGNSYDVSVMTATRQMRAELEDMEQCLVSAKNEHERMGYAVFGQRSDMFTRGKIAKDDGSYIGAMMQYDTDIHNDSDVKNKLESLSAAIDVVVGIVDEIDALNAAAVNEKAIQKARIRGHASGECKIDNMSSWNDYKAVEPLRIINTLARVSHSDMKKYLSGISESCKGVE